MGLLLEQLTVDMSIGNVIITGVMGLQIWLVQRSFSMEKQIAMMKIRMEVDKCPAGLIQPRDEKE